MSLIRKLLCDVREWADGSDNLREDTFLYSHSIRMTAPSLNFSITQAIVGLKRTYNCDKIVICVGLISM